MGAQFCSLGHTHDAALSTIRPFELDGFDKPDHRRSYSSDEQHVLEAAKMVAADRSHCPFEPAALIPALFEVKEAPLQEAPGSRTAVHRNTGVARRLVTLRKPRAPERQEELRATVRRLQHSRQEGIARILEVFEDHRSMSLVMEQCAGGTVYDRILQRQYFAEQESAVLVRHLLQSVAQLHGSGLSHGHLTPDAFRFQSDQPHASLKLVDLGLDLRSHLWEAPEAKRGPADQCLRLLETCRVVFCAPEVARLLQAGRGPAGGGGAAGGAGPGEAVGPSVPLEAADVWGVGAIAFLLLCGYPPFYAPCRHAILLRIGRADYSFDPPFWSKISEEAKDFVQQCLRATPARRLSVCEALQHPWIQSLADTSPSGSMLSSFTLNLRRFYRTSIIEVYTANSLAVKLNVGEMQQLYRKCCEADVSQAGFLTATDLRQILHSLGYPDIAEALGMCSSRTLRHPGESYIDYAALAESVRARRARLVEEELWSVFLEFAGGGRAQNGDDPAGASSTGLLPQEHLGDFLGGPPVQRLLADNGVEDGTFVAAAVQDAVVAVVGANFDDIAAEVLQRLPAPLLAAAPAAR